MSDAFVFLDPPSDPRNLTVADSNKTQITVRWEKPKSDGGSPITGYVIETRSPPNPDYETAGRVDADTTSFTADGLKEGNKYYIRVKAENPAGLSESGAELKKPAVAKLPFGETVFEEHIKFLWRHVFFLEESSGSVLILHPWPTNYSRVKQFRNV